MVISESMLDLVNNSSAVRKMFEEGIRLAAEIGPENVFNFSLGNPSVPAPAKVADTIRKILDEMDSLYVHGYMPNAGYPDVRKKVADYLNRCFDAKMTENNILMTCGAAGGLNCIMRALLNPGDEVICFAPYFGEYRSYAANFGGKVVPVPVGHEDFQLNLEAFPAYVTEKTKAVILNSPNNPTGVIYSAETLDAFNKLLIEAEEKIGHPIFVVCDEPYRALAYDGATVPYMPAYIKNTIIGSSFSKTLSLPGERIGYIAVPSVVDGFDELMSALVVANRTLGYVNAPSLMQLVAAECLDEQCDVDAYDRNRQLLYNALLKDGFSCVKPEGAFYLFVKSPVEDDEAFVEAAKKYGILMVSMKSWGCPGYVRLAYCTSYDMIERSLPAFEKLAKEYNLI
ncbi:MAG: pyridoxal phosphate-dependent aminotransferase [Lachnospiraceae bacterium]|nr:pyridoxal phosphate-dependent aminotransferase [Candidatus Equihabitans merdae]